MPLEQAFVAASKGVHDLKGFDCGKPIMNTFLAKFAEKHSKLGLSRTYVLPEVTASTKAPIAAYFTLTTSSVTRAQIPTKQSLPCYPVPVILMARLAVDARFKGVGLGGKALIYALRKAVALHHAGLPAFGLILDVLDDDALGFYQRFELFDPLTDDPMRLFVSMKTLEQI
ncbi:MAG: GNAT family N-acetyltransferase [Marinagarivorans sp.]|nr:GNAT family N-acetyltransferase [Marinagarivorans sp.]